MHAIYSCVPNFCQRVFSLLVFCCVLCALQVVESLGSVVDTLFKRSQKIVAV